MEASRLLQILLALMPALVPGAVSAAPGGAPGREAVARFAVLDVDGRGAVDDGSVEGLAAVLAAEIGRRPGAEVIRSAEIRGLLGHEAERQLLGCSDEDTACLAELGGALGVDFVIHGEATVIGDRWLLSLTLLDARRARAVGRSTRSTGSEGGLVDEVPAAVGELLAAVPGLAAPKRRGHTLRWVGLGTGAAAAGTGAVLLGSAWSTWLAYDRDPRSVDGAARQRAEVLAPLGVGLLAGGAALTAVSLLLPWGDGAAVAVLPAQDGMLLCLTLSLDPTEVSR